MASEGDNIEEAETLHVSHAAVRVGAGAQHALADASDIQPKPCYDQSGLMRQYDYIAELVRNSD